MHRHLWPVVRCAILLATFVTGPYVFAQTPASPRVLVDGSHFGGPVDLTQHWLVHSGTDPAWAATDLDESGWTLITPSDPSAGKSLAASRFSWYRTHVQLPPGAKDVTFLTESTSDYALWVNGQHVGTFGSTTGKAPSVGHAPPFRIPDELIAASGGRLTIALECNTGAFAGYVPPLATKSRIRLMTSEVAQLESSQYLAHSEGWKLGLDELNVLLALCGLILWVALRDQTEYLWLAVWMFCQALSDVNTVYIATQQVSAAGLLPQVQNALSGVLLVAQVEFVRRIARMRWSRWLGAVEFSVIAVAPLWYLLMVGKLPFSFGLFFVAFPYVISFLVCPILLVVAARRGNLDARMILVPFALWALRIYYDIGQTFWVIFAHRNLPNWPNIHIGTYDISTEILVDVIGLLALLFIILARTIRLSRERAGLRAELAAAEEIQSLLLARSARPTPGFVVETQYFPAGEVGGDFFLISPGDDGSLLAIVGDVSGKGMQAAMRVSLILGALNRETSREPAEIMTNLNRTLLDQGDHGFTTACCVHLQQNGSFTFTNAGHINPYTSGVECASAGQLPLGITDQPGFSAEPGILRSGEQLILLSDGVAEARNAKGELFGFDRTSSLTTQPPAQIAETARRFGQEDDITVVSIQCVAAH